jgi:hypothetical protein
MGAGARRRAGAIAAARRYLADRSAAVSGIFVMALVPIIGGLAVGLEASNWWLTQRSVQNAADEAVISSAWNGGTACSGTCNAASYTTGCTTAAASKDFDCEAVAAAAKDGFTNGSNNANVYPQYLTSGCPGSLSVCWKVTVSKKVPIYLMQAVGYFGNVSGQSQQLIQGSAVAGGKVITVPDCLFSIATTGNGITTDGSPSVNLDGCNIQSNSSGSSNPNYSGKCNGHNLNADAFSSPGVDNGCARVAVNGAPAVTDPYNSLKSNILPDPCASYPQESAGVSLMPAINKPTGTSTTIGTAYPGHIGYYYSCGDVQLQGNVTLLSDETLIIYNGVLDLNGNTLSSGTTHTTLIFAGQDTITQSGGNQGPCPVGNGSTITPCHFFTGTGTLQLEAPTSGTWSGIAVYQSPVQVTSAGVQTTKLDDLTTHGSNMSLDVTNAGSSPTIDIQGVFYFPNAQFTVSGAINNFAGQTSNGCFVLTANVINLNGQGSVFANSQTQCGVDGVTQVFGQSNIYVLMQ